MKSVVFAGAERVSDEGAVDHSKLDLALLEIEPAIDGRPDKFLKIATDPEWTPGPDRMMYMIGYPYKPNLGSYKLSLLEQLFLGTYGWKRLAPGLIQTAFETTRDWTTAHDATTLGGNSGSAALMIGHENAVAGLHYGGRAGKENWAHKLSRALEEKGVPTAATLREALTQRGAQFDGE